MATEKFAEELRTFETRLRFIDNLFSNRFSQDAILSSCIMHKLDSSFFEYIKAVHRSAWQLSGQDPMTILKKIDN